MTCASCSLRSGMSGKTASHNLIITISTVKTLELMTKTNMWFRMTRSNKHKAQEMEKAAPFSPSDIHNISDTGLEALLVSIQEEQIKRHLIRNKPKKLKLTINDVKVKSNNIHFTFEGIDTIIISDIYDSHLIHAGTVLIGSRWLNIGKFSGSWTLEPFTQIEKKHQGGDPEYLLQILDKLDPDKVCSYWEVLQWLLEAVCCGEKHGDEKVKEWAEQKLDNMSDSDDEETEEERRSRTKWLDPIPATIAELEIRRNWLLRGQ
jgi:hypothetical protein